MSGISELNKIGMKGAMPAKMRGLLFTSIARSKLTYGLECCELGKKETY